MICVKETHARLWAVYQELRELQQTGMGLDDDMSKDIDHIAHAVSSLLRAFHHRNNRWLGVLDGERNA